MTRLVKATLLPTSGVAGFTPVVTRAAATATRVNELGLIELCAANSPRFDYDPVTKACRGLLIEPSSVNLVLQSENFGTTWAAVQTPTRTAAAFSIGILDLDLLGDDSATLLEGYQQTVTFTGNAVKAVSLFMKKGTSTSSFVQLRDSTAVADRLVAIITFNSAGVPSVTMSVGTHLGTDSYGEGVYRFRFRSTSVTAANSHLLAVYAAGDIAASVSLFGDVYVGGVQAENAEICTSYIPTTTGTVTRNNDVVKLTSLTGWHAAGLGSLAIEWSMEDDAPTSVFPRFVSLNDNTASNRLSFFHGTSADLSGFTVTSGGVSQADFTNGAVYTYASAVRRAAAAWATNDIALSVDGTAVTTDATATIPTVTQLEFGADGGSTTHQRHLRKVLYYPKRVVNADLQTLSLGSAITDQPSLEFDFTGGKLNSQIGPLTRAMIGYESHARGLTAASVTVSSEAADFPRDAPLRPETWEAWKPTAVGATWQVDLGSAQEFNYVGILGSDSNVQVEISTDASVWRWVVGNVDLDLYPSAATFIVFPLASARFLRLTLDAIGLVNSVYVGNVLVMEKHVTPGHMPLNLARETELTTTMSRSGQMLGQTIRRMGFRAPIAFSKLTPSWIRTNFQPFVLAARQYPYFTAWNPSEFPEDVAYGWTEEDIKTPYAGDVPMVDIAWNIVGFDG